MDDAIYNLPLATITTRIKRYESLDNPQLTNRVAEKLGYYGSLFLFELDFLDADSEYRAFSEVHEQNFVAGMNITLQVNNANYSYADFITIENYGGDLRYEFYLTYFYEQWRESVALKDFIIQFIKRLKDQDMEVNIELQEQSGIYLRASCSVSSSMAVGQRICQISDVFRKAHKIVVS